MMSNWLMFGALGLIWGASYLLIKIGVQELDALSLVSGRLGVTAIAFVIAFLVMGKRLPRDRKTWIVLVTAAMVNTTLPFLLITWSESSIDSGLASVLNSTTPLFSIVIAHALLADDKITVGKLLGLVTGFLGIILLAVRGIDPTHNNPLPGQLAVLIASVCYGFGAVFVRRNLRHIDPMVNAGATMMISAVCVIAVTLLAVHPLPNVAALQPRVQLTVLGLGLINTFIAYILYYRLIKNWGASRTTMVTYVIPTVGLLLGAVFEHEVIDLQLLAGGALIIGGVALVNLRRSPPKVSPAETTPAGQPIT
jgi:drug/metabolite transporter (DMT)-like permease